MGIATKVLWLELIERCNLSCPHCLVRRSAQPEHELDLAFHRELLTAAARLGFRTVTLTGGEPLLHKDFREIYTHAHESGFSITVNTNATRISKEIAELWRRFPPGDIKISFYGCDELAYDAFVGCAGGFRLFEAGIHSLRAAGVSFRALLAPHPLLLSRLGAIQEYARALGCRGPLNVAWNMLLHTRDNHASERIRHMRPNAEAAARIKMSSTNLAIQDLRAIAEVRARGPIEDSGLFQCIAAKDAFCVDAFGVLQPCRLLRSPEFTYDLKRGTLREGILKLESLVLGARTKSGKMTERCLRCALRPACSSCPATSWLENGVVDEPVKYYCDIAHCQAYWLGILQPGAKGWEVETSSTA